MQHPLLIHSRSDAPELTHQRLYYSTIMLLVLDNKADLQPAQSLVRESPLARVISRLRQFIDDVCRVLYLIIKQIFFTFVNFFKALLCCYIKGPPPRRKLNPKHIFVKFDAWTYRGTDSLWASLLEALWEEVENEFGKEVVTYHRAGIELVKKSDITYDDKKGLEQAQNQEVRFFIMKKNMSISALLLFTMFFIFSIIWLIITRLSEEKTKSGGNADIGIFVVSTIGTGTALATVIIKVRQSSKFL